MTSRFQYCPACGAAIAHQVPPGDDRPRDVCSRHGDVFYHNPRVVVGCVPEWQNRILLCRRAIAPRYGFWTLPAGFLELGETTAAAGIRETWEEARVQLQPGPLFTLINVAHIGQIHMFYRAAMPDGSHAPGVESLETALIDELDIPWRELAFPTIYRTLERYFADRRAGSFNVYTEDLGSADWQQMRLLDQPGGQMLANDED